MPVEAQLFLCFFTAMIGFGILVVRLFVIERLRLVASGRESSGLRWARRALDVIVAQAVGELGAST
ncbi:hypothetical protein [Agromyces soli]|uniref:Uncharacterized protein n=1 Tax=Agromyces soli TaxID=659012 RepID=A0ABY4AU39_9MICO|nr:hypothetical protein [Agromyces soli]UOE26339.1 hypothetical protein MTP13_00745 [Agromyces soli]